MTNKQAWKTVEFWLGVKSLENELAEPQISEALEVIKKNLEVLEILKNSYKYHEEHRRKMSDPINELFMILHMTVNYEENVNKVKEWIKNENNND